jgi:hypothetical protein
MADIEEETQQVDIPEDSDQKSWGPAKRRVMKWRVISESYDFGELCSNHAQTTPTFSNDHTQFLNSPDVSLN